MAEKSLTNLKLGTFIWRNNGQIQHQGLQIYKLYH